MPQHPTFSYTPEGFSGGGKASPFDTPRASSFPAAGQVLDQPTPAFKSVGPDAEGIVAQEGQLLGAEVAQAAVLVQHHGEDIVGEGAAVPDLDHHAVAEGCLDRHGVAELVDHPSFRSSSVSSCTR